VRRSQGERAELSRAMSRCAMTRCRLGHDVVALALSDLEIVLARSPEHVEALVARALTGIEEESANRPPAGGLGGQPPGLTVMWSRTLTTPGADQAARSAS
jgi:hypothetical protein